MDLIVGKLYQNILSTGLNWIQAVFKFKVCLYTTLSRRACHNKCIADNHYITHDDDAGATVYVNDCDLVSYDMIPQPKTKLHLF